MLRNLVVQEDRVLEPHVEEAEDFLLDLADVGGSLDELGRQARLGVQLLVLARLEQIWVVLVIQQLLDAQQESCQLQLGLIAQVLVLALRVRHALWALRQPL